MVCVTDNGLNVESLYDKVQDSFLFLQNYRGCNPTSQLFPAKSFFFFIFLENIQN